MRTLCNRVKVLGHGKGVNRHSCISTRTGVCYRLNTPAGQAVCPLHTLEGKNLLDRDRAEDLLTEYTRSPRLLNHSLAVEAARGAYARRLGEDELTWRITGLLHDFDYERWPEPENHPLKGSEILRSAGYPEQIIYAILSHAQYLELERKSPLDQALFAVDELCGLITAVALVRPSRSILDVTVRSIKKKWKQRSFAEGVSREDIALGASELGVDLDKHIGFVLEALQGSVAQIGLIGLAEEHPEANAQLTG